MGYLVLSHDWMGALNLLVLALKVPKKELLSVSDDASSSNHQM